MKSDILLKKVVLVAIFSALCCAATYLQIRMPAGDFVHLGNFVMIIAALLLGGVEGGAVGSLGMGIYDLINYAGKTSTILRTFILKFIIGFIVVHRRNFFYSSCYKILGIIKVSYWSY